MRTRSRPIRPRPERRVHPPQVGGDRTNVTIVCDACGCEVVRETTVLSCDCGTGLVAQWHTCLGRGVYLGRIVFPEGVVA